MLKKKSYSRLSLSTLSSTCNAVNKNNQWRHRYKYPTHNINFVIKHAMCEQLSPLLSAVWKNKIYFGTHLGNVRFTIYKKFLILESMCLRRPRIPQDIYRKGWIIVNFSSHLVSLGGNSNLASWLFELLVTWLWYFRESCINWEECGHQEVGQEVWPLRLC